MTVAVAAARPRWTRRAGGVSGIRGLSASAVLFIIHVGRFGAQTQRQVMRYRTAPGC